MDEGSCFPLEVTSSCPGAASSVSPCCLCGTFTCMLGGSLNEGEGAILDNSRPIRKWERSYFFNSTILYFFPLKIKLVQGNQVPDFELQTKSKNDFVCPIFQHKLFELKQRDIQNHYILGLHFWLKETQTFFLLLPFFFLLQLLIIFNDISIIFCFLFLVSNIELVFNSLAFDLPHFNSFIRSFSRR